MDRETHHRLNRDKNEYSLQANEWATSFAAALTKLQVLARQEITEEEQLIWVAELSRYPIDAVISTMSDLIRQTGFIPKLFDVQRELENRFVRQFVRPPDCPKCGGSGLYMGEDKRMRHCPCAVPVIVDRKQTVLDVDGEGVERLSKKKQQQIAQRLLAQIGGQKLLSSTAIPSERGNHSRSGKEAQ